MVYMHERSDLLHFAWTGLDPFTDYHVQSVSTLRGSIMQSNLFLQAPMGEGNKGLSYWVLLIKGVSIIGSGLPRVTDFFLQSPLG